MTTASYDSPTERYSYKSAMIDSLRGSPEGVQVGRVNLRLAEKFGFCWGVDRAVAMVWDAIRENPGRTIWLLNQIIHNPKVNEDFLRERVRFVFGPYASEGGFDGIRQEDLVVIPAFSAEVEHMNRLQEIGCEIVDTTCPWVEKPHRRVLRYLEDGYTVLIHGLRNHDETRATCSLVESKQGHFLVVNDMEETEFLCGFLLKQEPLSAFQEKFASRTSTGFDPEQHLVQLGIINQTTMLASESRAIAVKVAKTMLERDGAGKSSSNFRDFDTICPATQDNQDAVMSLPDDMDVFLVLGGYDSSNTRNLLRAAKSRHGSYHLQSPRAIEGNTLHHRDPQSGQEVVAANWLPEGPVTVGLSAGASTPDTELEAVIRKVCESAGEELSAQAVAADTPQS